MIDATPLATSGATTFLQLVVPGLGTGNAFLSAVVMAVTGTGEQ